MRPFGAFIERKILEINARYASRLADGFLTPDFPGQPEPETLQCASDLDRTNWLGLVVKAQAAISQGFGDVLCDPPIRCTSNREYSVTYADALGRMFALLDQVGAAQANWWAMKDAARACRRRQDLDLIDLDAGWP